MNSSHTARRSETCHREPQAPLSKIAFAGDRVFCHQEGQNANGAERLAALELISLCSDPV